MPGPTGANAHIYGGAFDQSVFTQMYRLYKIKLLSGGPVQTYCGRSILDRYSGGCMLQPSVPAGSQTGTEYWLHTDQSDHTTAGCGQIMVLDSFSPKSGVAVNLTSNESVLGTLTTDNVDECVAFRAITVPPAGGRLNWKVSVVPGPVVGDVITQYICCNLAEKFYTAPFIQKGTYYDIVAPPVVYAGQTFWITVIVMQAGTTLTTYAGTSSFTSTDAAARLEGQAMDGYDYVWQPAADGGVRVFITVTLSTLGLQSILASDVIDGSITGLATVQVVGADVKLTKQPPLQVSASGDVVQFRICWSNYSTASASTFTITDAVPNGTVYAPDVLSNHFCGATKGFGAAAAAYSTDGGIIYTTIPAGGPATTGVTTLRWTIPLVGVATTGCACFRVTVQ